MSAEPTSPATEPAPEFPGRWQELEDLKYRASLIQCRIAAGLTLRDVAMAMGRSDETVQSIEDVTTDPHLSTLRRYAAAVGAVVQHRVQPIPADEPETNGEAP